MSAIRRLLDDLHDTTATAKRLGDQAELSPEDEILRINAESVAKRRTDLERRLDAALRLEQHDLVGYHINREVGTYPAIAIGKSMVAFQELVTSVFDALRSIPKLRYRPSPESVALSTMDFAGARMGSVAVSMHIPNDRLMMVESDLDQTFSRLFELLASRRQDEFRELVETIGVASISKAYTWAEISSAFGLDTSIQWGKSVRDLRRVRVSHSDALSMKAAIESASDESEIERAYDCMLEGIDPIASYFHITLSDGSSIKGETAAGFPRREWTVSKPYRAELTCKTVVMFATGQEKITWTLNNLEESDR